MKIIAIANQKGGVGKTTTAMNLASALQKMGNRICCLDFDPQCHLAKYMNYTPDGGPTITDYIFSRATYSDLPPVDAAIRQLPNGIALIPGDLKLSKADMTLSMAMFRERILAEVLSLLVPVDVYDYLLIDCNPSMGILLTNVLAAADYVLIPVQVEEFSTDGLADMLDLVDIMQHQLNPSLRVLGLLPTMVAHNGESREVLLLLHEQYPQLTMDSEIRRSVDAPRSTRKRIPLVGTKSLLGLQYEAAAAELSQRLVIMEGENER